MDQFVKFMDALPQVITAVFASFAAILSGLNFIAQKKAVIERARQSAAIGELHGLVSSQVAGTAQIVGGADSEGKGLM